MLGYLLQAQAEGAGVGAGVGVATDSAMSWSKQHTTARRCGDHNEHSLQTPPGLAQCTTTRASEDDTTSETGTTYTRAPRVELQPRRTARNRGDTLSLGYLKNRPTKKTLVPGP